MCTYLTFIIIYDLVNCDIQNYTVPVVRNCPTFLLCVSRKKQFNLVQINNQVKYELYARGLTIEEAHNTFCTQLGHCPSFILRTGERIIRD